MDWTLRSRDRLDSVDARVDRFDVPPSGEPAMAAGLALAAHGRIRPMKRLRTTAPEIQGA